jgi:membrane protease YdiL (CAAX protease family)
MTTETPASPGLIHRIFRSPPVRIIVLGFLLVYLMAMNGDIMLSYGSEPIKALAHIIAIAIAGFAVYIGYARFAEQRNVSELALPGMGRELGIGMLVGFGLYATTVLLLIVMGIYRIEGLNPLTFLIPALAMAVSSGVFEELLFRGVLFSSVEKWFGSWAALLVSSLVFGLVHLMNPQGTLEGALFIAVEAGILLAGAYMLTGRLWMSMGFHFAWNYTQEAIFSGIVSGTDTAPGLIKATIDGPELLTGGSFGLESSVLALALCTTTGIVLVFKAVKRGKIVPPFWKRGA